MRHRSAELIFNMHSTIKLSIVAVACLNVHENQMRIIQREYTRTRRATKKNITINKLMSITCVCLCAYTFHATVKVYDRARIVKLQIFREQKYVSAKKHATSAS